MAGTVNGPITARESYGRHEPEVEEVRPGIWSLPVLWPNSPLRYTLAYLLSHGNRATLIDTGWPTEAGGTPWSTASSRPAMRLATSGMSW